MRTEFVSQTPFWYILLCIGVGIFFAFLFYFRTGKFTKNQRILLAFIRGVLSSLIAFLLLNPLIKTINSIILKPVVAILIDDSRSMTVGKGIEDADNGLKALIKDIEQKGYEVALTTFGGEQIEDVSPEVFRENKTNISAALNLVTNNYEGQNLSDVIIMTDGIINDGVRPTFKKYPFNIHTIGYGDSTLKRDGLVLGVSANRLAYLGNDFIVNVDVSSSKLAGKTAEVSISNDVGEVLDKTSVLYDSDDFFKTVSFKLPATEVGKKRFVASLQVVEGESNVRNNHRDFVVDIVDGREKILLLAYAPHPDIKAIKSIIEKNDLFELNVKIVQSTDDISSIGNEVYDILILHHFPDSDNLHTQFLGSLLAKQKPVFFILGNKSNISYFNGMQNIVGISTQLNQTDKVSTKVNPSFQLFNISDAQANLFAGLPPLTVPFGNYNLMSGTSIILDQYVNGINVSRPLMAVNLSGSRKMAAFLADGLWQWRLEEYALTQSHEFVDDLISRTIQLISIKEDKSRLRVYPISDVFEPDQTVVFIAETYNEIFERIYDINVNLKLKPATGSEKVYEFKVTESSSRFELTQLPAGTYNYEATAMVVGNLETSTGQFVITDSDIEMQNTVADFNMLRTLSNENNGAFVTSENIIEIRNNLDKVNVRGRVIAQEELSDIINLRWLLILILVLATFEWVFRKYLGSY